MVCANCQTACSAKAKFCVGCGAPIGDDDATAKRVTDVEPFSAGATAASTGGAAASGTPGSSSRTPSSSGSRRGLWIGIAVAVVLVVAVVIVALTLTSRLRWPESKVTPCNRLGCQREGKRTQAYTVHFLDASPDGDPHSCDFDEKKWRSFGADSEWQGEIRVLTGGVDCDSLRRGGRL